jgi:hypothetical protein
MRKAIFTWLCIVIVFTLFAGLSYLNMDISFKYHLYDEQNALIEQAVEALNQDKSVKGLFVEKLTIEQTNQCFVIVYDEVNAVTYTNGTYQEKPLYLPLSLVLTSPGKSLQTFWTPSNDLHFATVSKAYNSGHVVVGKNSNYYNTNRHNYQEVLIYVYGLGCVVSLPLVLALRKICKIT